jgi:hypothetical protein
MKRSGVCVLYQSGFPGRGLYRVDGDAVFAAAEKTLAIYFHCLVATDGHVDEAAVGMYVESTAELT